MQFNLTPVVRNLLLINIAVFVAQNFFPLEEYFGLRYILASSFAPYQFLTYMFAHGGIGHLFSNMFALFMFGPLLERFWGPQRFLFFYLFTGIGAGLLYEGINFYELHQLQQAADLYVQNPTPGKFVSFMSKYAGPLYNANYEFVNKFEENPANRSMIQESIAFVKQFYDLQSNSPMIGASGAVFGLLMAFGLLFPNTELFLLFIPFPVKAKYFVAFYGVYELYAGIQRAQGDNVAHFAHIGGMLFAYILIKYWNSKSEHFY